MRQKKEKARPRFTLLSTIPTGFALMMTFGKNFGYAALSRIYHELGIHTFLTNRQRHSKEQYDANAIMKMLVIPDSFSCFKEIFL